MDTYFLRHDSVRHGNLMGYERNPWIFSWEQLIFCETWELHFCWGWWPSAGFNLLFVVWATKHIASCYAILPVHRIALGDKTNDYLLHHLMLIWRLTPSWRGGCCASNPDQSYLISSSRHCRPATWVRCCSCANASTEKAWWCPVTASSRKRCSCRSSISSRMTSRRRPT